MNIITKIPISPSVIKLFFLFTSFALANSRHSASASRLKPQPLAPCLPPQMTMQVMRSRQTDGRTDRRQLDELVAGRAKRSALHHSFIAREGASVSRAGQTVAGRRPCWRRPPPGSGSIAHHQHPIGEGARIFSLALSHEDTARKVSTFSSWWRWW